jgi:hypothetical protein
MAAAFCVQRPSRLKPTNILGATIRVAFMTLSTVTSEIAVTISAPPREEARGVCGWQVRGCQHGQWQDPDEGNVDNEVERRNQ